MEEIFIVEAVLELGGTVIKFNIPHRWHFEYVAGSRSTNNTTYRFFPYQYNIPEILERIKIWSPAKKDSKYCFVDYPFQVTEEKRYILSNYWLENRVRWREYTTKIDKIRTRYIANDRKGDRSTYNNFED